MTETLETVVRNSDHLDIPQKIKDRLRVREGDRIRWTYEGDRMVAEVIKKKKGTLGPLVGKFSGESTDSVKMHNISGNI